MTLHSCEAMIFINVVCKAIDQNYSKKRRPKCFLEIIVLYLAYSFYVEKNVIAFSVSPVLYYRVPSLQWIKLENKI